MIWKYVEFGIICDKCRVDGTLTNCHFWLPESKCNQENWGKMMSPGRSKSEIRKTAKAHSWVTRKNDQGELEHICPRCIKKEK